MTSPLVPIDATTTAIVHGTFTPGRDLLPFGRSILLVECHVAGTSHRTLDDVAPASLVGRRLELAREPANRHDRRAILVLDAGRTLGYVPRDRNEVLARLLDAGKLLFATVTSARRFETYLRIDVGVYLEDL